MGLFKVTVGVANPAEAQFTSVEAVVDTGAVYSVLPAALLETLGVSPTETQEFTLGDRSIKTWGVGEARFRIDDRERTTPVIFGEEGVFLLGAVTLEAFALIPDTTHKKLVRPPELLLAGVRGRGFGAG